MIHAASDMGMADETLGRIVSILNAEWPDVLDGTPIDRETSIQGSLRLDSVVLVALFVSLEDEFGVVLRPGDLSAIVTVGELVDVIVRLRGSSLGSAQRTE